VVIANVVPWGVARACEAATLPRTYRELLPTAGRAQRPAAAAAAANDDEQPAALGTRAEGESDDEEERAQREQRNRVERAAARRARGDDDGAERDDDATADIRREIRADESYVCCVCGATPKIPVLCLHCRNVLCARGSKGELSAHAATCGGGTAHFIQLRNTQALVVQSECRAQVLRSPYADKFGEEDVGLRRGRPLFLDLDAYRTFLRNVVRCSWDHNTQFLENGMTFKDIGPL
jgi:hypothetical protein